MDYPIMNGERIIGTASISQQGKFSVIHCCCHNREALGKIVYLNNIRLGRCVPENDKITLTRRIACREMPAQIELTLRSEQKETRIVLREESPVPRLEKLSSAKLDIYNGILHLSYPD